MRIPTRQKEQARRRPARAPCAFAATQSQNRSESRESRRNRAQYSPPPKLWPRSAPRTEKTSPRKDSPSTCPSLPQNADHAPTKSTTSQPSRSRLRKAPRPDQETHTQTRRIRWPKSEKAKEC